MEAIHLSLEHIIKKIEDNIESHSINSVEDAEYYTQLSKDLVVFKEAKRLAYNKYTMKEKSKIQFNNPRRVQEIL